MQMRQYTARGRVKRQKETGFPNGTAVSARDAYIMREKWPWIFHVFADKMNWHLRDVYGDEFDETIQS